MTNAGTTQTTRRVLVADRHEDFRVQLVLMLAQHGHDVRAVANDDDALAECAAFSPEIAFVDTTIAMRGITPVVHKLRTCMAPRGLIIGMSLVPLETAVDLAFDRVFLKPFPLSLVHGVIAGWFPGPNAS